MDTAVDSHLMPFSAKHANFGRASHGSYVEDFNLPRAGNMARKRSVAIVFLTSDSGEEYITVDGNQGDRYVLIEKLWSRRY